MPHRDFDNWEHKTFPLRDVKVDEEGTFTGYASIFGVVDAYNDVVMPGAFKKTIRDKGKWPLFYAHISSDLPVGTITGEEDSKGLKIRGRLSMRTQRAQDVRVLMLDEAIDGLSIGYQTVKEQIDEDSGARLLKEINLWEISLCPRRFEACPGARPTGIKTAGPGEFKPYPNEHACRLREPGDFEDDSFVRTTRSHEGKKYSVIMARLKGEETLTDQAFRYKKDVWDADEAKAHCKAHDGSFEAASGKCQHCRYDDNALDDGEPAKATPPDAEPQHKDEPAIGHSASDYAEVVRKVRESIYGGHNA